MVPPPKNLEERLTKGGFTIPSYDRNTGRTGAVSIPCSVSTGRGRGGFGTTFAVGTELVKMNEFAHVNVDDPRYPIATTLAGSKVALTPLYIHYWERGQTTLYTPETSQLAHWRFNDLEVRNLWTDIEQRQLIRQSSRNPKSVPFNSQSFYLLADETGVTFSSGLWQQSLNAVTLEQLLKENHLPIEEKYYLTDQLIDYAIGQIQRGIVHRDLKPSNIMIEADLTLWVIDYDAAKTVTNEPILFEDTPTDVRVLWEEMRPKGQPYCDDNIKGTPGYMAPEVIRGKIHPYEDLFPVGLLISEIFSGEELMVVNVDKSGFLAPHELLLYRMALYNYDDNTRDALIKRARSIGVPEDIIPYVSNFLDPHPDLRPQGFNIKSIIQPYLKNFAKPRISLPNAYIDPTADTVEKRVTRRETVQENGTVKIPSPY